MDNAARHRSKRSSIARVLLASLLTTATLSIHPWPRTATAACKVTPEGRVLVMSNNVYEAAKRDANHSRDMKRFVARMKEMSPSSNAPDILLVQEARKKGVRRIRDLMIEKFGCKYSVVANASRGAWRWIKKYWKLEGQDTAVIMNVDSMVLRSRGHISHPYSRSKAARGASVKVKMSAWAEVREIDRPDENKKPLTVVAASAHFPRGSAFRNERKNRRLKRRFSVKLARVLESKQAEGGRHDEVIHVIAGDFNMTRYKGSPRRPMPPYKTLTSRPWNFVDGPILLARRGNPNPIDFLFSTGKPLKARMDMSNNRRVGSKAFYSNHDLRWSLLSAYPQT